MPTVDQIFPQTIVAENPYTTQPKSLSKNCVKQEERTSLTPRIEILLDKFPTFKSFLEYNNPSRQFEIVKHPYKYLFGNSPTLSEVNIAYQNNECSNIWLIPQIADATLSCGLKEDATKGQFQTVAMGISVFYHWLKIDELMMFFFGFKLGRYERFYSRFDTQIFMGSIPLYLKKRNEAIDHAIKNGFV